jgi:hypothetical protein
MKKGTKSELEVTVKKGIPQTCVNLPPFLSIETRGVCILIGNTEMFLAEVYKSPQRLWSDADITELLVLEISHPGK